MSEILASETVFSGWLKVLRLTFASRSGARIVREVVERGHAAAVLPYDPDRRMALLVRLPRPGATLGGGPDELTEAPAGMLDAGETGEAAARREAMEEAGVRLGTLEPVGRAFSSPGAYSEHLDLFLAPYGVQDRLAAGGGVAGEHEDITVVETPLADLAALADAGGLLDLKTLTLVLALRLRRPDLFAA
jgi:nudix-type nucleoside diphosphatase (YffH/AdpP family)